jgi:hypothetical protein
VIGFGRDFLQQGNIPAIRFRNFGNLQRKHFIEENSGKKKLIFATLQKQYFESIYTT